MIRRCILLPFMKVYLWNYNTEHCLYNTSFAQHVMLERKYHTQWTNETEQNSFINQLQPILTSILEANSKFDIKTFVFKFTIFFIEITRHFLPVGFDYIMRVLKDQRLHPFDL
jgi:hypothetical protein